jgi:hypothetical protein
MCGGATALSRANVAGLLIGSLASALIGSLPCKAEEQASSQPELARNALCVGGAL